MKVDHLRIDGKEELALMGAYPARIHTLHQACVFIDEPCLTQYIGCCVL